VEVAWDRCWTCRIAGVDIGVNAGMKLVDRFRYLGDMLGVGGDADAAVETGVRVGWSGFGCLVPLLAGRDVSLIIRMRLCSSCVQNSMLHGNEICPVRKENEVALQWTETRTVRLYV